MLMACTSVPPEENIAGTGEPDVPAHGGGACNAAGVQDLVGRQRAAALGTQAMRRSGARTLRWIEPDSAYTMDYREDRLDIEVDARGRITRLRCG
jgi:hypothetical protein